MGNRLKTTICILLVLLIAVAASPMAMAADDGGPGHNTDVGYVRFSKKVILPAQTESAVVPILLYHHISATEEESDTVLHPATFAMHMAMLKENGYEPVSFDDLTAFAEHGEPLPEKPVIITFDDGYLSNYQYAFPILVDYGFPATIFVIGSSVGQDRYKDTEHEITPHFGRAEMQEMEATGLIDIQSHTYDMHQSPLYEPGIPRETILPHPGESLHEYKTALENDVLLQNRLFAALGIAESSVLAYPLGRHTVLTTSVLKSCGYRATVTTDPTHINVITHGQPQSLYDLGRMNIDQFTTADDILSYLTRR